MSISELQYISLVVDTKAVPDLETNCFSEFSDVYTFLQEYYHRYNDLPDKLTLADRFDTFKAIKVTEPIDAIIDRLREEALFRQSLEIFNKASDIISKDSRAGIEYLRSAIENLNTSTKLKYTDAVANAKERLASYQERMSTTDEVVPIFFKELNHALGGFYPSSVTVLVSRTGMGKSQTLAVLSEYAARMGFSGLFISPEMSTNQILTRFDVARSHLPAMQLFRGLPCKGYDSYIEELAKSEDKFYVCDSSDFADDITVVEIEKRIKVLKPKIVFIDDISYITPRTVFKNQSEEQRVRASMTNFMQIAVKYAIPIVISVQANRKSLENEDGITLANLAMSDGIGRVASSVFSLNHKDGILEMKVLKNRLGRTGDVFHYSADYNTLTFNYIPSGNDVETPVAKEKIKAIF